MERNQRRSKLEMYVDILKILAQRGPLKLTHIMYKANVNCTVLGNLLESLCQQSLAEKIVIQKRKYEKTFYNITENGRTALNYYKEITIVFQTNEEPQSPYLFT